MMTRLAQTVVEPTAKNGFIFTLLGTKWGFLWLWLLIINAAAFLAYGLDKLLAKLKARHEKVPRLPERNLLLLAIVGGGMLVTNPIPEEYSMDHEVINKAIDEAVAEANRLGIHGKETTPFLLAKIKDITGGDSLASNIQLVYNNARLAAKTACELVALAKN